MAKSDNINKVVNQVAIQVASAVLMALRDTGDRTLANHCSEAQ